MGNSLQEICDLEGNSKEIHKGNPPTLEGNLPCWREILHSLQENKDFFQAWREALFKIPACF